MSIFFIPSGTMRQDIAMLLMASGAIRIRKSFEDKVRAISTDCFIVDLLVDPRWESMIKILRKKNKNTLLTKKKERKHTLDQEKK